MPVSTAPSPKEVDEELCQPGRDQTLLARGAEVNIQLKAQQPYRTKLDRGHGGMLGAGNDAAVRACESCRLCRDGPGCLKGAPIRSWRLATAVTSADGVSRVVGTNCTPIRQGRVKTGSGHHDPHQAVAGRRVDITASKHGRSALVGRPLSGLRQRSVQCSRIAAPKRTSRRATEGLPSDAAAASAGGAGFAAVPASPTKPTIAVLKKLMP